MRDYSIGVDLGGTNLRIAAVDSDGKLLEKLTTGTEVQRGRDFVIGEMCNAIQSLAQETSGVGNCRSASASGFRVLLTWIPGRSCALPIFLTG